jgi:hypothetical protein
VHTAATIAFVMGKAFVFSTDRTMKVVRAKYLARKTMLYRLIKDLQRHRTCRRPNGCAFSRRRLYLIASFVRSHRADLSESEIYVSLLVEDGADIVVVARDREHRKPALAMTAG